MKKSAFVVGATGATGKAVVDYLINSEQISQLNIITRKSLELPPNKEGPKVVETIVSDFNNLSDHAKAFGTNVGICALGTTRAKSGASGFIKVDKEYVIKIAELAHAKGCSSFSVVTAAGANARSYFLYPKTKGEVEEKLSQIGFRQLNIFRPALLLGHREESRPLERFLQGVSGVLDRWHVMSLEVSTLARAICKTAFAESTSDSEGTARFIEHGEIVSLGKF